MHGLGYKVLDGKNWLEDVVRLRIGLDRYALITPRQTSSGLFGPDRATVLFGDRGAKVVNRSRRRSGDSKEGAPADVMDDGCSFKLSCGQVVSMAGRLRLVWQQLAAGLRPPQRGKARNSVDHCLRLGGWGIGVWQQDEVSL